MSGASCAGLWTLVAAALRRGAAHGSTKSATTGGVHCGATDAARGATSTGFGAGTAPVGGNPDTGMTRGAGAATGTSRDVPGARVGARSQGSTISPS